MTIRNIETIIWDWNGTLLNDINHCISSMNILLKKRHLKPLYKKRYLSVFTFPVKDYYARLGFDFQKEPFEIPAEEFIVHYNSGLSQVALFEDVSSTLNFFQQKGLRQYIVSAMKQEALLQSVNERGIADYFERITGIKDNLAFGKNGIANELLKAEGINPQNALFIGDTLHDAEVAAALGIPCILLSRGHQQRQILEASGNLVFASLTDFINWYTKQDI